MKGGRSSLPWEEIMADGTLNSGTKEGIVLACCWAFIFLGLGLNRNQKSGLPCISQYVKGHIQSRGMWEVSYAACAVVFREEKLFIFVCFFFLVLLFTDCVCKQYILTLWHNQWRLKTAFDNECSGTTGSVSNWHA